MPTCPHRFCRILETSAVPERTVRRARAGAWTHGRDGPLRRDDGGRAGQPRVGDDRPRGRGGRLNDGTSRLCSIWIALTCAEHALRRHLAPAAPRFRGGCPAVGG